jgi:hypothetical protein
MRHPKNGWSFGDRPGEAMLDARQRKFTAIGRFCHPEGCSGPTRVRFASLPASGGQPQHPSLYRQARQCHDAFVQIIGDPQRGHAGSSRPCPGTAHAGRGGASGAAIGDTVVGPVDSSRAGVYGIRTRRSSSPLRGGVRSSGRCTGGLGIVLCGTASAGGRRSRSRARQPRGGGCRRAAPAQRGRPRRLRPDQICRSTTGSRPGVPQGGCRPGRRPGRPATRAGPHHSGAAGDRASPDRRPTDRQAGAAPAVKHGRLSPMFHAWPLWPPPTMRRCARLWA